MTVMVRNQDERLANQLLSELGKRIDGKFLEKHGLKSPEDGIISSVALIKANAVKKTDSDGASIDALLAVLKEQKSKKDEMDELLAELLDGIGDLLLHRAGMKATPSQKLRSRGQLEGQEDHP